jgi:hypothetical protein
MAGFNLILFHINTSQQNLVHYEVLPIFPTNGSGFYVSGLILYFTKSGATNRRPDLSTIAPGQRAARMPGTGPLRRSSVLARKKAIVGKSRIAPDRHQRLSEEPIS